jgi:hypothetical protein
MPARGPLILTEDEAEHLLDLLGRPTDDDTILITQLRAKVLEFLKVSGRAIIAIFFCQTSLPYCVRVSSISGAVRLQV